jgi:hypothetical protein
MKHDHRSTIVYLLRGKKEGKTVRNPTRCVSVSDWQLQGTP